MVQLTCQCCGYTQSYGDDATAFQAGWDSPPRFSYTACPLCPGSCAVGMAAHHKAHRHWEKHGRPDEFGPLCVDDTKWGLTSEQYDSIINSGKEIAESMSNKLAQLLKPK